MLYLDATIEPPTHVLCLTTRDPETTAEQVRRGSNAVWQALRRRYGRGVEYFARIEFTTGKAATSGGLRRLHQHAPVKGLGGADVREATEIVRSAWEGQNVGAWRVEVARLRSRAGLLQYLSLHHAKAEQLPPAGWVGRTERVSRGYWSWDGGGAALREEARRQLWAEGLAYATGLSGTDARFLVEQQRALRDERRASIAEAMALGAWEPVPLDERQAERVAVQARLWGDDDIPF